MTTREVSISFDARGYGKVVLDGHDLSNYVTGTSLRTRAGSQTEVTLTIGWANVAGVVSADIEADVSQLQEDIAVLLYGALRKRFFKDKSSPAEQLGGDGGDRRTL